MIPETPAPGDVETVDGIDVTHGDPVEETVEETTTGPAADTDRDDEGPEESKATRLRKRAQEAEAERDTLRDQLAAARRALVEQAVERRCAPTALWASGVDPEALFTADGDLDTAALTTAVDRTVAMFGLPRTPKPDPSQGATYSGSRAGTWGDVLNPQ